VKATRFLILLGVHFFICMSFLYAATNETAQSKRRPFGDGIERTVDQSAYNAPGGGYFYDRKKLEDTKSFEQFMNVFYQGEAVRD